MRSQGTTASGPELLIELRRERGRPLRAQLEDGLRDAVRSGRLMAGAPLSSSRALARDLGVSRRLVVEAFAQLSAEGYLVTRQGAGTFVAEPAAAAPAPTPAPQPRPPRYDFFPGAPDLSAFPRAAWARAVRDALRETPDHELSYGDPRGAPALRTALAGYLIRARGVVAQPERMVITSGAAQALALLAGVLVARGTPRIAVEDPSLPTHIEVLAHRGAEVAPVQVDDLGSASKTLAPGLRLGWLVLPADLVGEVASEKLLADMGSDVIGQLALARLIETGSYDRHLRVLRRRHRARRDAMVAAVERHLPGAEVLGIAAGLHANVLLADPVDVRAFEAECEARSVRVYGSRRRMISLGYANVPEPAIEHGVRLLAEAVREARGPASGSHLAAFGTP